MKCRDCVHSGPSHSGAGKNTVTCLSPVSRFENVTMSTRDSCEAFESDSEQEIGKDGAPFLRQRAGFSMKMRGGGG